MNRLEREILKALLINEKSSIYGLQKYLKESGIKSNYTTVWRYIKRMQKEGLLITTQDLRKNGSSDRRETEILDLSPKGLATALIEGDFQEKELRIAGIKIFQTEKQKFSNILPSIEPFMTDIFSDSILELKPKVNLKFFDEEWFREIFRASILKACEKAMKKYHAKFEKEGIWDTKAEIEEDSNRLLHLVESQTELIPEEE